MSVTANIALILWIPLSILFFSIFSAVRASLVVFFGGIFFLPEIANFSFPMAPVITKQELVCLCVLLGLAIKGQLGQRIRRARFGSLPDLLVLLGMVAAVFTARDNQDVLTFGPTVLRGHSPREMVSYPVRIFFETGLPYVVGRLVIQSFQDLRALLRGLFTLALVYSVLILFEARMSPQLHNWVYGYTSFDFIQSIRWGGYRASVFLTHGLAVGTFCAAIAVLTTVAHRLRWRMQWLSKHGPDLVVPLFRRCVGDFAQYRRHLLGPCGLTRRPCLSPKNQFRFCVVIALVCMAYPVSKLSGLFPEKELLSFFERADKCRSCGLDSIQI